MLTQQQLEEIRADDAELGDEIRFRPEVYTHRRQLLELVAILMEPAQPAPAEEPIPLVVCSNPDCFLVYSAQRKDCPVCKTERKS